MTWGQLLYFVTGAAILIASAWFNIAFKGAAGAEAALILSMIGGLAIGAVAVSKTSGPMRWVLVGLLLCGELAASWMTFERTLAQRGAATVEYRVRSAAHVEASDNLAKAEAALQAATNAVRDQASLRGCKANCRALLEAAVEDARRDVEDRRADLSRTKAPVQVEDASTVTGLPGWVLSAIFALLMSLATNGTGAVMIALACHAEPRRELKMDWQPLPVRDEPVTVSRWPRKPPGNGFRRFPKPENVEDFNEHKVLRALRKAKQPVSNGELAQLLGETEGEASKSWREVAEYLDVGKCGRELRIALRA